MDPPSITDSTDPVIKDDSEPEDPGQAHLLLFLPYVLAHLPHICLLLPFAGLTCLPWHCVASCLWRCRGSDSGNLQLGSSLCHIFGFLCIAIPPVIDACVSKMLEVFQCLAPER
jgi:hypothetical protein